MDKTQMLTSVLTILGVFVSSGIIQFFVNRSDKKKADEKEDAIDNLRKEFSKVANDKETNVMSEYSRHDEALNKMNKQHEEDFKRLTEAIKDLTDNDSTITACIQEMVAKQDIIADSLLGQAHDRIMYLTDQITERGCITNHEKATLKSMYEPYKGLGGNGDVQEAVEYVLKTMPTVSNEESSARKDALRYKKYQEMRDAYENYK